jgi:REP element-mobilizing transposase RayT
LRNYDYAQAGAYFITICTQRREWLFGEVMNGEMRLSALGEIADRLWYTLPGHHPKVELDAFVVMPNHVHGIVVIHDQAAVLSRATSDDARVVPTDNPTPSVRTRRASSDVTISSALTQKRAKGPSPNSLGAIIGAYKSAVTKAINAKMGLSAPVVWQRRYHDHIIRSMQDLARIRDYVEYNPARWEADTFFVKTPPADS